MAFNYYLKKSLKSAVDELQQAVKEGWIGGLEAKRAIHKLVVNAKAVVQIDADVDENIDVDENENDLSMAADGHCTCKADNAGSARNTTMVTRQGNQNGNPDSNLQKEENERKESNKENKEKEEKGVVEEGEEKKSKKSAFFLHSLVSSVHERVAGRNSTKAQSKDAIAPPTLEEVRLYHNTLQADCCTPEEFYDSYTAYGWKNKEGRVIEDWQAELRNWVRHRTSMQKAQAEQAAASGNGKTSARALGKNSGQHAAKKVDLSGWLHEHYPLPQLGDEGVSEKVATGIVGMLKKYSLANQQNYVSSKVLEEARSVNCISDLESHYGRSALMHVLMLHLDSLAEALGSSKTHRTPERLEQIASEMLRSNGDLRLAEFILAITQCKRGKYDVFHDKLTQKNMCKAMEQFRDWRRKEICKPASPYLN